MNAKFMGREWEELKLKFFTSRTTMIHRLLSRLDQENQEFYAARAKVNGANSKDAMMALGLVTFHKIQASNKLGEYTRGTLVAMMQALSHPDYSVLQIIKQNVPIPEQTVRESASYFGTLYAAGKDYRSYGAALDALHKSGDQFSKDISALRCVKRAHAESVLRLIIHFLNDERLSNKGCPETVVNLLKNNLELVDELAQFADDRKLFLSELDVDLFLSVKTSDASALSGGML